LTQKITAAEDDDDDDDNLHLHPGVGGRIILRWNFRKRDVAARTESSWLRIGTGGGHF